MVQAPVGATISTLRLNRDGIRIRETARRLGISRNRVKKYLAQLQDILAEPDEAELAGRVYDYDSLAHESSGGCSN